MFWRCRGSGRKDRTRKDFVSAVAGFEQGSVNHASSNGSTSTSQQARREDGGAVPPGHEERGPGQNVAPRLASQAPPPYPEEFARNGHGDEERPPSLSKAPGLIPKRSELTNASDQQSSMPQLVSPDESSYFESEDGAILQQPEWVNRSYSRYIPNVISGVNQTQLEPVGTSDRRAWLDDDRVQSEWTDETRSVAARSVRPGWINDTGSFATKSVRPDWINEMGSVADPSVRSEVFDDLGSVDEQSVRPGWYDETTSRVDNTESIWVDRVTAPPVGKLLLSEWVSPKNARIKRPTSPEITDGGQSSFEGASRPPSELASSPTELASGRTTGIQGGSRIAHHIEGERGLLYLITDTNEKDRIRRRHENLRSAERARRVFSSSPAKEQTSRQGTAEAPATAKIRVVRSKTMPMSETGASVVSKPSVNGIAGGRPKKNSRDGTNKIPTIPRAASTEAGPSSVASSRAAEARRLQSFGVVPVSDSTGEKEKKVPALAGDPRAGSSASATARGSSHLSRVGPRGGLGRSGIAPPGKPPQETSPTSALTTTSRQELKMWPTREPEAAAAAAPVVLPLSKPIMKPRQRVRGQQPFPLGTPRLRTSGRKPTPPHLPKVEEEGVSTSPLKGRIDVAEFSRVLQGKELGERLLAEKLGGSGAKHGALVASPSPLQDPAVDHVGIAKDTGLKNGSAPRHALMPRADPTNPSATIRSTPTTAEVEKGGGKAIATASDNHETAKTWLRDESHRRRGPGSRLSRSSSWDEGSSSSFQGPPVMFSPGRFNPTSGALSRSGSMDESWCDSSVRSTVTTGTRNSSSTSLVGARGPSDVNFVPPQLSKNEKQTVERLKIKRSDVHFGYRTVGGSKRVYKIELNGEMRAAKVINTLGMNKDEMVEVLDTFDAELLALSRLNTPHIVKVYGASVSPAEVILVSEFVDGGVLRGVLDNPFKLKHLTQRVRLGIAKDTAMGMKSLYAHGMQHRHLSSNSILLTSDYRAKILGVGLTMTTELIGFYTGEERVEEEFEKELPWASREVLAGGGFSEKSDVYSFGIIMWEVMQKDPSLPYAGLQPSQVVGAKYNGEGPPVPKDCPPKISTLMKSCWSNLPSDRPSFDKICDDLESIIL